MSYYPDLVPRLHSNVADFPIEALGPLLGPAVVQHHLETGIAIEAVATCALAVAHAVVQDLVDVQRPDCAPSPCSAMYLVVTAAGEGMDRAAAPFLAPLRDLDAKATQAAHDNRFRAEAELEAWKAQKFALTKRMQEAAKEGGDLIALKAEYEDRAACRPGRSSAAKIVHDTPTFEAWQKAVGAPSESVLLFTPHAEGLLNTRMDRFDQLIGSVVDCLPLSMRLPVEPSSSVRSRASALLGVKQVPYRKFLNRRGPGAAMSEVLGSALTVWCHANVGGCYQQPSPFPSSAVAALQARLTSLMHHAHQRRAQGMHRDILPMSFRAVADYGCIFNTYQQLSGPGQMLNGIPGVAAKAPEHVARQACMFQCIEDREGPIEIDVLSRASRIIQWHVNQQFHALAPGQFGDQREVDAQAVASALIRASANNLEKVSRHELYQWCQADMTSARFRAALNLLVDRRQVMVAPRGHQTYLVASPSLVAKKLDWPFSNAPSVPHSLLN